MSESRAEFVDIRPLSPQVSSVRLAATEFVWIPGQFVEVALGSDLRRPYSLANEPNQDHIIELAAALTKGDAFSEALLAMSGGDDVTLTAPQGELRRGPSASVCYIATGTGLSPVRSMLRAAPTRDSSSSLDAGHRTTSFGPRNTRLGPPR